MKALLYDIETGPPLEIVSKPQFRGKAELVRYADDLCLFFGNPTDVDMMRTLLQARRMRETRTYGSVVGPTR